MKAVVEAKKRTVVICGFAPETRELANQEPPETEIWGLNQAHQFLRRYDRWFQMHPRDWRRHIHGADSTFGRDAAHLKFLQECQVPVYMQKVEPDIPKSVAYPVQEIWERLVPQRKHEEPYFTSSPTYMMGLAIDEGVGTIKVYGINFSTEPEYIGQRPCIEFWAGIAMGRGIEVVIPHMASLLRAPLYAYVEKNADADMAQTRMDRHRDKFYGHHKAYHCCVGGYRELIPVYRAMADNDGKRQVAERMGTLRGSAMAHFEEMRQTAGQMREAGVWLAHFGAYDLNADTLPSVDVPDEFKSDLPSEQPKST